MSGEPLEHAHKLGAILEFIALNEEIYDCMKMYDRVEAYLSVENYTELTENESLPD